MKNEVMQNDDKEMLSVCDEVGNALYTATRRQIHTEGLRHRVIHLWFADDEYLYFQQRSVEKEAFPLGYDITCAGHIDGMESAEAACIRECKEELGITLTSDDFYKIGTYYEEMKISCGMDRELADVFICRSSIAKCSLNTEVLTVGKIKLSDIHHMLYHNQSTCIFYDIHQFKQYRLTKQDIFLHETAYYQWLLKAIISE